MLYVHYFRIYVIGLQEQAQAFPGPGNTAEDNQHCKY